MEATNKATFSQHINERNIELNMGVLMAVGGNYEDEAGVG